MSQALLNEASQKHRAGDYGAAEAMYKDVLRREPGNYPALYRLGFLYGQQGSFAEAERLMGEAARINPRAADAHFMRGSALLKLERDDEAVRCFDQAVALAPSLAEAWFNRAVGLVALRRFDEALTSADQSLALAPGNADAFVTRAVALTALGRREDALAAYGEALALNPGCTDALVNRASIHAGAKRYVEAAADCERALAISTEFDYLPGFLLFFRMNVCDWRDYDALRDAIAKGLDQGKRVIQPHMALALCDAAAGQLKSARIWATNECAVAHEPLWRGEQYRHDRIRVAYLSEDFRDHPVARLIACVLEQHDRSRFEIVGISLGPIDSSAERHRIERACDRFIDASRDSDADVAALICGMEVDIAVDMMGFTGSGRRRILPRRPAPVQISFLGFAGTMGAAYMDYLIADATVLRPCDRPFYSEKIVTFPYCYLPAESMGSIARETASRADAGLPESGFVFACFNRAYKIVPEMFRLWMRLLGAVNNSVLWLGSRDPAAMRNLAREAESCGVHADRLIFARYVPSTDDHLARLALADLFLDTLPHNAHSTAIDALSSGVPVLTCAGRTFAGRVAASLNAAIGIPKLVAGSLDEYEALARVLARDPARISALKTKLAANRATHPLFDSASYTRHLEAAYIMMQARIRDGLPPADLSVPP